MKQLLIIYHSYTGGTALMVKAAAQGGRSEKGTRVRVMTAGECEAKDMLAADGYIFATPENLAAIAGVMKTFFDRNYYPLLGEIEGRPYAAMICAGSDGDNARKQLERIATGWRLKKVMDTPIICTHAQTESDILAQKTIGQKDIERCSEVGATMATGLALGVF